MQMSLRRDACWPCLPSGQATLDQSRGGEVGRDHEKGLAPRPVFGMLTSVPKIITGHLMQGNLIGIRNPGNAGNQSRELACPLLLSVRT